MHTRAIQTGIFLNDFARAVLDVVAAVGEIVAAVKRPEMYCANGTGVIVLVHVGVAFVLKAVLER